MQLPLLPYREAPSCHAAPWGAANVDRRKQRQPAAVAPVAVTAALLAVLPLPRIGRGGSSVYGNRDALALLRGASAALPGNACAASVSSGRHQGSCQPIRAGLAVAEAAGS